MCNYIWTFAKISLKASVRTKARLPEGLFYGLLLRSQGLTFYLQAAADGEDFTASRSHRPKFAKVQYIICCQINKQVLATLACILTLLTLSLTVRLFFRSKMKYLPHLSLKNRPKSRCDPYFGIHVIGMCQTFSQNWSLCGAKYLLHSRFYLACGAIS
jgi:hypothetical protein